MTERNMLTRQCSKCGAPLVKKEGYLFCEYCHTSYDIPGSVNHHDDEKYQPPIVPDLPAQSKSFSYEKPITSNQKKSKAVLPVVLVSLMMAFMIWGAYKFLSASSREPAQINPEVEIQEQMYRVLAGSTSSPEAFPGDFHYEKPIAIGAILSFVKGNDIEGYFNIDVIVKNLTEDSIVSNKKTDIMLITSTTVVDNLGNHYSCQIYNDFSNNDVITYGQEMGVNQLAKVGRITCNATIPPEVKYIQTSIELTNWGTYDFQIPLVFDIEKLEVDYSLYQDDEEFSVNMDFAATPPQYLAIYYNDISVIDDKGNTYPLIYCGDFLQSFVGADMGSYYASFAQSSAVWAELDCSFSGPIPYEVNAITLIMNIRGNTLTHTFTTDTVQ